MLPSTTRAAHGSQSQRRFLLVLQHGLDSWGDEMVVAGSRRLRLGAAGRDVLWCSSPTSSSWVCPCRAASSFARKVPGNGALQVTDPLLYYRSMAAKGEIKEDAEQIRVLVELRKLTRALQDYIPPAHLLGVLQSSAPSPDQQDPSSSPATDENINALVKHLSEESFVESLDTPRGLLLTGKPGTGKSFLVDTWFECLPVRGKFRRHYHHLLLTIYRLIWLEAERRRQGFGAFGTPAGGVAPERGVGAVWQRVEASEEDQGAHKGRRKKSLGEWARTIRGGVPFLRPSRDSPVPPSAFDGTDIDEEARKGMDVVKLAQMERQEENVAGMAHGMGTTLPMHVAAQLFLSCGHVLVFDEIQLLDIASATLLRRILTSYWRLGGVVVATSNRVPEDLYANNVQRRSLVAFLAALKERCPVVEVGGKDWRVERYKQGWGPWAEMTEEDRRKTLFFVRRARGGQDDADFDSAVAQLVGDRKPEPSTVQVYNRQVAVTTSYSQTQSLPSTAYFSFSQLCDTALGPADYLTLASTYGAFVLDDIPALDLVHRNQARRLITLIDALYEAKCKLIVRSLVPVTEIFFAREGREVQRENARRERLASGEATPEEQQEEDRMGTSEFMQSETLSEAMQDTEEGFRPNISAYGPITDDSSRKAGRRAEPGRESQRQERERKEKGAQGGLATLSIFSGEEERFAYQRAVSRLWEMSHPSWSLQSWKPLLGADLGAWRGGESKLTSMNASGMNVGNGPFGKAADIEEDFADEASYARSTFPPSSRFAGLGINLSKGGPIGPQAFSASQTARALAYEEAEQPTASSAKKSRSEGPPVLSEAHVWGVRDDWGPKAGRWGRGMRDLEDEGRGDGHESPRQRRARLREERLRTQKDKSD